MGDVKWTPGPWRVAKAHEIDGINVIAGKDDFVCEVGFPAPHNPVRADANLIAAAPELYEALSGLLQAYNRVSPAEAKPAQAAREALAKARGES